MIAFAPDGRVTVGAEAKAHAVENPLATVYSVKRLMGKGMDDLQEDLRVPAVPRGRGRRARRYRVQVESAARMHDAAGALGHHPCARSRRRAEAALGRPITQAVITVPAYFDDAQRQATRDAGRIAGLEVLRIVNEPTAAALAYGLDRKEDATIAVYDLGGGTFDVSSSASRAASSRCCTHGDTHLGGDDLDRELIDLITERDPRRSSASSSQFPPVHAAGPAELRRGDQDSPVRPTQSATVEIDLGGGRIYRRTITREEFEAPRRQVDRPHHRALPAGRARRRPDRRARSTRWSWSAAARASR